MPGQVSNISCLYFVLSLSPPLPERRTEHTTQGFRDVLGLFSEKTKLKKCRHTATCIQMVFAAVHCCAASTPTHQPAADTHEHHFLTHTMSTVLGSSFVPAMWGCWPDDSNLLFWAMSCLAQATKHCEKIKDLKMWLNVFRGVQDKGQRRAVMCLQTSELVKTFSVVISSHVDMYWRCSQQASDYSDDI